MDKSNKEMVDAAVSALARLALFVADELEPIHEAALIEDLELVYRVLVSAERCARQWRKAQSGN